MKVIHEIFHFLTSINVWIDRDFQIVIHKFDDPLLITCRISNYVCQWHTHFELKPFRFFKGNTEWGTVKKLTEKFGMCFCSSSSISTSCSNVFFMDSFIIFWTHVTYLKYLLNCFCLSTYLRQLWGSGLIFPNACDQHWHLETSENKPQIGHFDF